jgi:hypothetical protein
LFANDGLLPFVTGAPILLENPVRARFKGWCGAQWHGRRVVEEVGTLEVGNEIVKHLQLRAFFRSPRPVFAL